MCVVVYFPPPAAALCSGQCFLRYSMTTAVSAHLVILANENGGGFNVQHGQQQAGGTVGNRNAAVASLSPSLIHSLCSFIGTV